MTLAHATSLFFEGRIPAATKRLQALKSAGYVMDKRRRIGEPSVLGLTRKAYDELAAGGQLDGYPALRPMQFAKRSHVKPLTLDHELAVMDVKVAITQAIARSDGQHQIGQFTTWPVLSQFNAIHPAQRERMKVKPDGFLHIVEKDDDGGESDHRFFLELDRSTEVQTILADKCLCYREYYASGRFAERCGYSANDFRQHPFRVLVVLRTDERRNNRRSD
jgi:hypothetical protein